jgi:hypothetical protein
VAWWWAGVAPLEQAGLTQGCSSQRFLLALGVKPLEEKQVGLVPFTVLNKVYLTTAKFNGLLSGSDQNVASHYNIWSSYHHVYNAVNGNAYMQKYKEQKERNKPPEELARSASQPSMQPQVRSARHVCMRRALAACTCIAEPRLAGAHATDPNRPASVLDSPPTPGAGHVIARAPAGQRCLGLPRSIAGGGHAPAPRLLRLQPPRLPGQPPALPHGSARGGTRGLPRLPARGAWGAGGAGRGIWGLVSRGRPELAQRQCERRRCVRACGVLVCTAGFGS